MQINIDEFNALSDKRLEMSEEICALRSKLQRAEEEILMLKEVSRAGQDCGGTEAETGEERGADNGADRHYCEIDTKRERERLCRNNRQKHVPLGS